MFHSKSRRLALALAVACCTLAALGSAGTEEASASAGCNGTAAGYYLDLGLTTNNCNFSTYLDGTAPLGLRVDTSNVSGTAIEGSASASSGPGWGVYGITSGSGPTANGVRGVLSNTAPSNTAPTDTSAGVFGKSTSTTANGPGIFGEHSSSNGTAPGILGHTASTTSGSAGVQGQGGTCGFCLGVYGTVPGNGIGVRGEAQSGNGW